MRKNNRFLTAVLATVALVTLSACGDDFTGGSGDPATTTTTVPGALPPAPTGDPEATWPKVDGQLLPTGATEGGELVGDLRNLGADEVPWGEDPVQVVLDRVHQEPLFASELAQEFGKDAAAQVAFWGLNGLWKDGSWTEAGNGFLKVLEVEILEHFQGVGNLPESGKYQVVLANAEKDAVRLNFAGSELKAVVGEVSVFKTECGVVGVDVRGNLYIPCDCGRIPIKRTPPPRPPTTTPPPPTTRPPGTTTPPPPTTRPPGTTTPPTTTIGGKDAGNRPPQDTVVTCPTGEHADRNTGKCVADEPTGTLPDQGDPSNGDSGPGAPGTGVTTPKTDPAPNPTVPTNTGPGDGPIPTPNV